MEAANLIIIIFNLIVFSCSLFLVLRFRHIYDKLMAVFYIVLISICIYQINIDLYKTEHFMMYRLTVGLYSLLFFYKHLHLRKEMRLFIKDKKAKDDIK